MLSVPRSPSFVMLYRALKSQIKRSIFLTTFLAFETPDNHFITKGFFRRGVKILEISANKKEKSRLCAILIQQINSLNCFRGTHPYSTAYTSHVVASKLSGLLSYRRCSIGGHSAKCPHASARRLTVGRR